MEVRLDGEILWLLNLIIFCKATTFSFDCYDDCQPSSSFLDSFLFDRVFDYLESDFERCYIVPFTIWIDFRFILIIDDFFFLPVDKKTF